MPANIKDSPVLVGLFSGRLDSLIAVRLLQDQGVPFLAVHFDTGFTRLADRDRARALAAQWGFPLKVIDVAGDYLASVVQAADGPASRAAPLCLRCRVFQLRRAWAVACRLGARGLFTGEVPGQGSRGQTHADLRRTEDEAGVAGRVLRPCGAKLLPTTGFEKDGTVDRNRLGRIHGRSRRVQRALAKDLGVVTEVPGGGGCCRLSEPLFARRLRDELSHGRAEGWTRRRGELLGIGRHFRLSWRSKQIVGRNQPESTRLKELAGEGLTCQVDDGHGSFCLVLGDADRADRLEAASIAARFSRQRDRERVRVRFRDARCSEVVEVRPAATERIESRRV